MFKMLRFRDYLSALIKGPAIWFLLCMLLMFIFDIDSLRTSYLFLIGTPAFVFLLLCVRSYKIDCDIRYEAKTMVEINKNINNIENQNINNEYYNENDKSSMS